MALASYEKKVNVSTDGAIWHPLAMTSPSLETPVEVLETTNLATNVGYRNRILGLHDWSIAGDVIFDENDTALMMVRNAKLNRTVLHVQYLSRGTVASGYQGEVVVESFSQSGEVGSLEMVSISMLGDGALVQAT